MATLRESKATDPYLRTLEELHALRQAPGEPAEFWNRYLRALTLLVSADAAVVTLYDERGSDGWRIIAAAPHAIATGGGAEELRRHITALSSECMERGVAGVSEDGQEVAAVRLETGGEHDRCIAAVRLNRRSGVKNGEAQRLLRLVADIPSSYQLHHAAVQNRARAEQLAGILDLMVVVGSQKRFLASTMAFCNEVATRFACERSSVGWLDRGYVKLQAMSHVDKFDRKSEAANRLEAAMEEALDQDTEIVLPPPSGTHVVVKDHRAFCEAHDVSYICTIPIRVEEKPVALCSCERLNRPFSDIEVQALRLACDHVADKLSDLKARDRWFGARLFAAIREKAGGLLGYEHTWAKIAALCVTILLGIVIFGEAPYRPRAPVILRTDDLAYLTAPFDGHIDTVSVRVGDAVKEGAPLLGLDQRDVRLQEAALLAEKNKFEREFDKARATNSLADMRIIQAQWAQVTARIDLVRHQISQAVIAAPFDGILVEGDLAERIGSPVRQGDVLFKVARTDHLYAELEVNEADIDEVFLHQNGRIALASQPEQLSPIVVYRVEPVALAKEEGNVFLVNANFPGGVLEWWRPGMTGVARLDAGKRKLWWIAGHRTIDFIRLRLWL